MLRKTNPIKMMLIKTNVTHKQSQSPHTVENRKLRAGLLACLFERDRVDELKKEPFGPSALCMQSGFSLYILWIWIW